MSEQVINYEWRGDTGENDDTEARIELEDINMENYVITPALGHGFIVWKNGERLCRTHTIRGARRAVISDGGQL